MNPETTTPRFSSWPAATADSFAAGGQKHRPKARPQLVYPLYRLEHEPQVGCGLNREAFGDILCLNEHLKRAHSLNSADLGQSHQKSTSPSLQGTTYTADVVLGGVKIEATADTGASSNIISRALADSMNLTPEPGTVRHAWLPSGKKIYSPGRVQTTGRFTGEKEEFSLSCMVVEKTTHPLVLGSRLLRATKTFQKHMHRLKKVVSNVAALRLNLVGEEQEALAGFLNGARCMAVPDSGSDIMVLSRSHANARGFSVSCGKRHKQLVQLIDGSTMYTDGIVENIEWQFRSNEKPVRCNFHVIDNLPVDAILSGAMIDEYDIFTEYDDLIIQSDSLDDQFGIYNIRLAEKCRAEIIKLESSFLQDMSSDQAFSPSMIHRENARRDEIRTRIDGLLVHERQHQQELEKNRQAFFGEELRKHRQRAVASGQNHQDDSANALPPQAGPPIAGACQMTSRGPGATGKSGFWKGVRPKRLRLWKSPKA